MEPGGDTKTTTDLLPARDWSELPRDAIASVFAKLGAVEILMGAGLVCRSWLDAAMVPYLWRSLDMAHPNIVVVREKFWPGHEDVLCAMAKKAVDRSAGQLEVFIGEGFVDDGLLDYIGQKASSLKVLGLLCCFRISIKGFEEAITMFPLIEELKLSACGDILSRATCEAVGEACQNLRHFELVKKKFCPYSYVADFGNFKDDEAHGIAAMHGLRYLKISGSKLTNEALAVILDNCPHLESLDLHSCSNIVMDDAIQAKCAGIKISVSSNDDNSSTDSSLTADGYEDYSDYVDDWVYGGPYYQSELEEIDFDPPYHSEYYY